MMKFIINWSFYTPRADAIFQPFKKWKKNTDSLSGLTFFLDWDIFQMYKKYITQFENKIIR